MPVPENPVSRRAFLLSATLAPAARLLICQDAKDPKFTADVKVVNVLATVRDKQGKIVHDLTQDDFVLDEDGRPQTIRYFARESNLPLTLGLLVDTSGSQRRLIGEERSASYRFLDQVLRDKDQAFVIHFDSEVELLQDLTSSRRKLEDALAELELPQPSRQRPQWGGRFPGGGGPRRGGYPRSGGRGLGGTELYDAILLASDEIMKKQTGRKALIVLTDGVDNGSKIGLDHAVESAQLADTMVYGVRFADPNAYPGSGRSRRGGAPPPPYVYGDRLDGKKTLQRLSEPTGATFFDVSGDNKLEKIFSQIQEELRNQYSLGYTSDQTAARPVYRRIHLATKQTGLLVRTRDGYYAGS
jgi:VWFA-related protein